MVSVPEHPSRASRGVHRRFGGAEVLPDAEPDTAPPERIVPSVTGAPGNVPRRPAARGAGW